MARMEFFLISEDVSVDQQTNKLSLFNFIEQLTSSNFPKCILLIIIMINDWQQNRLFPWFADTAQRANPQKICRIACRR